MGMTIFALDIVAKDIIIENGWRISYKLIIYSLCFKMYVVLIFLDSYILLYTLTYVISRCIVNTMNLKKPK